MMGMGEGTNKGNTGDGCPLNILHLTGEGIRNRQWRDACPTVVR